jgi:hypothetical protein
MKPTFALLIFVMLFSSGQAAVKVPLIVIQTSQINSSDNLDGRSLNHHHQPIQKKTVAKKPSFFQGIGYYIHLPFAKGCKTDGFGLTAFILGFASLVLPIVPGIIVLGITLALAITSLIRIGQRSCRNPKSGSNGKPLLKGRGFAYVAIIGALLVLGILLLGTLIL